MKDIDGGSDAFFEHRMKLFQYCVYATMALGALILFFTVWFPEFRTIESTSGKALLKSTVVLCLTTLGAGVMGTVVCASTPATDSIKAVKALSWACYLSLPLAAGLFSVALFLG